MDIVTGLAATAKGLEIARSLRELDKSISDAEWKARILDLMEQLTDARMALNSAKEDLAERDAQIALLKENKAARMKAVSYRGFNFGIDATGQSIGRPFCPVCEKERGLQYQIARGKNGDDACPRCKASFPSGSYPWRLPEDFDVSSAE